MKKQIKKIPHYLLKQIQQGNFKEFFHILTHVKLKHVLIALAGRLDKKQAVVEFRSGWACEINGYLNALPYRRQQVVDDLYVWDFGERKICANYFQLMGLEAEYFKGLFHDIYRYEWKNKKVIDIGGFVGDSALYFLSQGAKKVVIYEPVLKNVQALNYNLKSYENQVECYQQALAGSNERFTLFSETPEGSMGFGSVSGNYRIECDGMTITTILNHHHPIDAIKVDCEGGETHLLSMSKEEMRSVPFWIVETHTLELYEAIVKKFSENGFSIIYDKVLNSPVSLLHFNRI